MLVWNFGCETVKGIRLLVPKNTVGLASSEEENSTNVRPKRLVTVGVPRTGPMKSAVAVAVSVTGGEP